MEYALTAIKAAGVEFAYSLRHSAALGPQVPITKRLGDGSGNTVAPPRGWAWMPNKQAIRSTMVDPWPLEAIDLNGFGVIYSHSGCRVSDARAWKRPGFAIGPAIANSAGEPNLKRQVIERVDFVQPYDETAKHDPATNPPLPINPMGCGIQEHGSAVGLEGLLVQDCRFRGMGDDAMKLKSAGFIARRCAIAPGGKGAMKAHFDGIDVSNGGVGGLLQDIWFDIMPSWTDFGRTGVLSLWNTQDVRVERIAWLGARMRGNGYGEFTGAYAVPGGFCHYPIHCTGEKNANLQFSRIAGDFGGFMVYPPPKRYGIAKWEHAFDMTTGKPVTL